MIRKALIFTLLYPLSISAQITNQATLARMSEADIQLQDKYIAAIVEQQIGKLEGAAKLFNEVLEKNPKCDGCAFQLSRLYDGMEKLQQSAQFAEKAVLIDPKNKWYQMQLAEIYEKIGKDKEAVQVYQKLIEQKIFEDDFSEELYFRLAFAQVRVNEPLKAIKTLDDFERKIGINEEISQRKHAIYEAMSDFKKATFELRKLADAFPQNIDYQHLAAAYYLKLGDKNNANVLYERILKSDPNDSKAQLALAMKSANPTGVGGSDINFLINLKKTFADPKIDIDEKIRAILPYIQKISTQHDKALAAAGLDLADILERTHPTNAKAYSLLGDMLYHNGRKTDALGKYKKCLTVNKTIYAVWEQKMYLEDELGLYDELWKTSVEATDLFPNQATAFYFNGLANERKGAFQAAIEALEQTLLMSSKKTAIKRDALIELGVTYSKSKDYVKSDAHFEEALTLDVKYPITLIRYAIALISRQTQVKRAQDMATEALKIVAENDAAILELYGDFLFKSGDRAQAILYWEKAKLMGSSSVLLEKKIIEKTWIE